MLDIWYTVSTVKKQIAGFLLPPFNHFESPGRGMVSHLLQGGSFSLVNPFWKHLHKQALWMLLEILNSVWLLMKSNTPCEFDIHMATLDCNTMLVHGLLLWQNTPDNQPEEKPFALVHVFRGFGSWFILGPVGRTDFMMLAMLAWSQAT